MRTDILVFLRIESTAISWDSKARGPPFRKAVRAPQTARDGAHLLSATRRTAPALRSPCSALAERLSAERTPEEIERAYRESPTALKAFLATLADNPGEWLSTKDLSGPVSGAVKKKYGWNELAGMLGAFGRRARNRYGKQEWFFDAERDHQRNRWVYRASPELAELIKQIIAGTSED